MPAVPLLSVVCPAYQEEDVLPIFHHELSAVLAQFKGEFRVEVIYVDDGSSDRTLNVLRDLAATDPQVRYLSLSRNFGHQAALTAGLEHARGDVIVTMDSDLQHPPRLIPELLAKWREGFDIVLTIRADDERLPWTKRFSSKLFYAVMRHLSDTDIRDAASDFRLMSRKGVDALLQLKERHRLLRGMVQWLGFKTAEIPCRPDARRAGRTKYTLRRMLRLAGEGFFSFSLVPLRVSTWLGMATILVGLAHALWLMISLARGEAGLAAGSLYLLVWTQLLSGAVLVAVGVLGEYVGRIFEEVKDRPLYLVKEMTAHASAALPAAHEHRQRDAA